MRHQEYSLWQECWALVFRLPFNQIEGALNWWSFHSGNRVSIELLSGWWNDLLSTGIPTVNLNSSPAHLWYSRYRMPQNRSQMALVYKPENGLIRSWAADMHCRNVPRNLNSEHIQSETTTYVGSERETLQAPFDGSAQSLIGDAKTKSDLRLMCDKLCTKGKYYSSPINRY